MKKLFFQVALLIVFSILLGVSRQYFKHGISWTGQWPTSSTSTEEAYRMLAQEGDPPFVSLQEMIDIQQNGSVVILDARSPDEYKAGRIPGALNLPYYEIDDYYGNVLEEVEADHPIVVYCEGVGCELSFFMGRELTSGGYKDIGIFYGGYPEWQKAGLPIEK